MKFTNSILVLLALFGTAIPAFSQELSGLTGQTNQEKLKNLFDSANPIQLSLFLKMGDSEISKWSCATVDSKTDKVNASEFPVLAETDVVTVPAVPSNGPLFPGSPAQTKHVQMIIYVDSAYPLSNTELAKGYADQKIQLIASPEVVETSVQYSVTYQETFRAINNMFVIKTEAKSTPQPLTQYSYCFKK